MIYYTSDPHHGHFNIMRHAANRSQFFLDGETRDSYTMRSVENMTAQMVKRWNSKVTKNDIVYLLGDYSYYNPSISTEILLQLNGTIHLIAGNHDPKRIRHLPWASVSDYREVYDKNKFIVLSHYPFAVWNKSHHGAYNFHGHSHGSFNGSRLQQDVGVDVWDYYPVTLEEIEVRMKEHPEHVNRDRHGRK